MASDFGIENQLVSQHFGAKVAAEIHGSTQVDLSSAKDTTQLRPHVRQAEEANPLLGPELDKDIDVAGLGESIGEYGTEQRQLPDGVATAKVGDLSTRNRNWRRGRTFPLWLKAAAPPALLIGAGLTEHKKAGGPTEYVGTPAHPTGE
jgi:hypothetical protein